MMNITDVIIGPIEVLNNLDMQSDRYENIGCPSRFVLLIHQWKTLINKSDKSTY